MKKFLAHFIILFLAMQSYSQPFVDVLSINHQQLNTKIRNDSFDSKINNTFAGVLLPIKVDSSNYFIFRANAEVLRSDIAGYGISKEYSLKSILIGVGWQHSFGPKFSAIFQVLPKLAADFKDNMNEKFFQYGASLLMQYKLKSNFRFKAGVYYNREPFGNFFVPLFGADIMINKKNWIYGQLPLYFRYEHQFNKKIYSGIGLRFFGRSFRLSSDLNNDYIFNQENQVKIFADYYLTSKFVVFTEMGQTINYGLRRYGDQLKREKRIESPRAFLPINDGLFINAGFCYRIRKSF